MCIRKTPMFAICKHSGVNNPNLTNIETDDCPTKDCESPHEQKEYRQNEKCFECVGVEPIGEHRDGLAVFFKHCFQSEICDHEFEHFITEIERDPFEPEVVLVTSIPCDICTDCKANGFDARPGATNPTPKTSSVIPRDFEGITRKSMLTVLPDVSLKPSDIYSLGASRFPQSRAPTRASEMSTTRAPASKALQEPSSSRHPTTHPSGSSVTPFSYKPSVPHRKLHEERVDHRP